MYCQIEFQQIFTYFLQNQNIFNQLQKNYNIFKSIYINIYKNKTYIFNFCQKQNQNQQIYIIFQTKNNKKNIKYIRNYLVKNKKQFFGFQFIQLKQKLKQNQKYNKINGSSTIRLNRKEYYNDVSYEDQVNLFKNPPKQNNRMSIDQFNLIKVLGKGSYAKVVLVKKKDDGKIFAIKMLKKSYIELKKQVDHIKTERNILVSADHPFIIKLYYSFQNERKLFFVLDYCPGGELFNLLCKNRRLDEYSVKFYSAQIVLALEYLHTKNIIYRDLKPENVLIDKDGYLKVADFGLSKRNVTEQNATSVCGTPEYLAPEVLLKKGHGKPVDWWTLGCLVYELITGLPPFYKEDRRQLFDQIKIKVILNLNLILKQVLNQKTQYFNFYKKNLKIDQVLKELNKSKIILFLKSHLGKSNQQKNQSAFCTQNQT
ncbi:protein kinase domain protein [Ichthyophthirius multifiliis]|uniref:non-specific serine/threonine protein kinase n=1 Tax=Ichthyophthirius multifiliis TaxID=5932 RepID=G0QXR6_ICHMU|nr:protein kinase domain protein [Ichthyophthirius multifiliis]EGR30003.1 protein kinase domain protein [Ichthyophthirius multifiliis]|eukprot:XP_004031239.1 protein kinase domain protein [Ichthyophthirius multifiliis]